MRAQGLGMQLGTYTVNAYATADLRGAIRAILARQAISGTARERFLAAKLLGDTLREPFGLFGRPVPDQEREQWHDDQLAIVSTIEQVMQDSDDPHVRLKLRASLAWHAERSYWQDIRERATATIQLPLSDQETLARSLREPIEPTDEDRSTARLRVLAETLAGGAESAETLAERLDAEVDAINSLPGDATANASPLLGALATANPELGEGLARWCVTNPARPLAQFGDSLLALLSLNGHETLDGLLEGLRGGDVSARRQLASYLWQGTWLGEPHGVESEMLRELVADEDRNVANTALYAVGRLAQVDATLTIDIALDSEIGTETHLAESLCMILSRVGEHITDQQVPRILDKLCPIPRFDYWADQLLAQIAPRHRQQVLNFLIDRAAAGMVSGLSFHESDVDLLGGAAGEELLALLREVRDAALDANPRMRWRLSGLYWQLGTDLQASLTVLQEWLTQEDEQKIDVASSFIAEMPWTATLTHPDFIQATLDAAYARDRESLDKIAGALLAVAVMHGDQSRTMGHAPERHTRLRDEGRELTARFNAGSPARRFYENVAAAAEARLQEAQLEDEEYPEIDR
jgi:hypothetical protein